MCTEVYEFKFVVTEDYLPNGTILVSYHVWQEGVVCGEWCLVCGCSH